VHATSAYLDPMEYRKIRIGTRGSPLALAQAHETRTRLMSALAMPEDSFEVVVISTTGDQIRDRPLSEIGGKGLFTKELEEALYDDRIDCAVHSMKDVPAHMPAGLELVAILPREDVRDAFISFTAPNLQGLTLGAKLGSSSVRRRAQALRLRPDLVATEFRGNVQTRLQKLHDGVADATFLAAAGLRRLGLHDKITSLIEVEDMLPAVAQGAIGIQTKLDCKIAFSKINHLDSAVAVACERAFMAALDGSCRTPIAGHAILQDGQINFRGEALTLDGKHSFKVERKGSIADAVRMGREAGEEVKIKGGALIAY
jgi:hydroxymethylbilane synthase